MATGLLKIDGQLNSFNTNGVWKGVVKPNSWYKQLNSNTWQYINANGRFNDQTKLTVNGTTYYFMIYCCIILLLSRLFHHVIQR